MILAEKIISLRKQNGWSQEELANQLHVSRQAVSKWESTASIPDLDKIIRLSEIFGVSTDYLIKDEIEAPVAAESSDIDIEEIPGASGRRVSLEEANQYMELVRNAAARIALGVLMCILCPVPLIVLSGMTESGRTFLTENQAGGIGVTILLLVVACAVAIFILDGMKLEKYEWMEKEPLTLQYGVAGIVETRKEAFAQTFKSCITLGVTLCIISVVPLMVAAAFDVRDEIYIYCTALLLTVVSAGVFLFVWSGMIQGSYQKLLEEGDYTREKKLESKRNAALATVYWCTVTAVYLGVSFVTLRWEITWVIWPCAGVFYAAVCGIASMLRK